MRFFNPNISKWLWSMLCCAISVPALSQSVAPSYEALVNHFHSEYDLQSLDQSYVVQFARKPDGWWVILGTYDTPSKIEREEQCWSANGTGYRSLSFPSKPQHSSYDPSSKFLNDQKKGDYAIHPYFGYDDWAVDVIRDFGDQTDLPDTTLYGLCRAYAAHSKSMLNVGIGHRKSLDEPYPYTDTAGSLPDSLTRAYVESTLRACDCYKRLQRQNTDFPTIVGRIDVKLANEYVDGYFYLQAGGRPDESREMISQARYPEYLLAAARNYLSSCPAGALLFTNGDNDTYPLFYVQEVEGYRNDVSVVNLTLLSTDFYVRALNRGWLPSHVSSRIPASVYEHGLDYWPVIERVDEAIDMEHVVKLIATDSLGTFRTNLGDMPFLPGKLFSWPVDTASRLWEAWSGPFESKITWNLSQSYVLIGEMLAYDLWTRHGREHPVCFASTMPVASYLGLGSFLWQRGFVYQLVPQRVSGDMHNPFGYQGEPHDSIMFDMLMNRFDWSGFGSLEGVDDSHRRFLLNARLSYIHLALSLFGNDSPSKSLEVLDRSFERIPDSLLAYDFTILKAIELYYQLERSEQAVTLSQTVFDYHVRKLDELEPHQVREWQRAKAIFEKLISLADEHGQPRLKQELERKRDDLKLEP